MSRQVSPQVSSPVPQFSSHRASGGSSRYKSMTHSSIQSSTAAWSEVPTQIPSFGAIQHQNPQAFYTEFDLSHNPLAMSSIPPSVSNHSAIIPFDFSLTEAVDEANLRHFLNGAFPTSTDTPDAASTFPSALAAIGQSPPPSHHLPADGLLISSALPYNQQDDFLGTNDPGFEPGVQQPGQAVARIACNFVDVRSHSTSPNWEQHRASQGTKFKIVREFPGRAINDRKKRIRTEQELQTQKEGCRKLRQHGGACLWCHRRRKKCDTEDPCHRCLYGKGACIRFPVHLSLHVSSNGIVPSEPSQSSSGRFFSHAEAAFIRLREDVARGANGLQTILTIREPRTGFTECWVADISEISMARLNASDNPHKQQLVSKLLKHIHYPELDALEAKFADHEVVQHAVQFLKLFMAIRCFAKTNIYVHGIDIDSGRMTVFYMLIIYLQALCEKSQELGPKLWALLYRRNPLKKSTKANDNSSPVRRLNPAWVASAVYYRAVLGLVDFETSPPMSKAFDEIKPHLMSIRRIIWQVVESEPVFIPGDKRNAWHSVREYIPQVAELRYFDIAFRVDRGNKVPLPPAVDRQAMPYSREPYDMKSFLDGRFKDPGFVPGVASSGEALLETSESSEMRNQGTMDAPRGVRDSEMDTTWTDISSTAVETSFYGDGTWAMGKFDQDSMQVGSDQFGLDFVRGDCH